MSLSKRLRFLPLTIHSFMNNYICKQDTRGLLDRYKDYLEQNKQQHHYGPFADVEQWTENAVIEYNITCDKNTSS